MIDIVTDPSKKIRYYFRVNSTPLPKTIYFLDENGADYPVNTKTWEVNFKRNPGDSTNVVQLTDGSGITLGVNYMTIEPTQAQVNIQPREYFIEIRNTTDAQSPFTGKAIGHQGEFDNFETDDLTITVLNNPSPRVYTAASTATLTPDIDTYDSFEITAQAEALLIANPTGAIGNFEGFIIRVTDNGTSRAISYGNKFRAFGAALPTATTIGKTIYTICIYNSTDDVYDTATREEV